MKEVTTGTFIERVWILFYSIDIRSIYIVPSASRQHMTLSLNCKDAGDPVCTHTMYGETEEELLANAKKHGIEVHGYTEENWNEEIAKNKDNFLKLIKRT